MDDSIQLMLALGVFWLMCILLEYKLTRMTIPEQERKASLKDIFLFMVFAPLGLLSIILVMIENKIGEKIDFDKEIRW